MYRKNISKQEEITLEELDSREAAQSLNNRREQIDAALVRNDEAEIRKNMQELCRELDNLSAIYAERTENYEKLKQASKDYQAKEAQQRELLAQRNKEKMARQLAALHLNPNMADALSKPEQTKKVSLTTFDVLEEVDYENLGKVHRLYNDIKKYTKEEYDTMLKASTEKEIKKILTKHNESLKELDDMASLVDDVINELLFREFFRTKYRAVREYTHNIELLLQGESIVQNNNWSPGIVRFLLQQDRTQEILTYCNINKKASVPEKQSLLAGLDGNDPAALILQYRICRIWEMNSLAETYLSKLIADYPEYAPIYFALNFLKKNIEPESLLLADVQRIHTFLQLPYIFLLTKYDTEILQEKINEIGIILSTENRLADVSLDRAMLPEVPEDFSRNILHSENHSLNAAIFRNDIQGNQEDNVIYVWQLRSKHPLAKFIQKIKTKFYDENTLEVRFHCGLRTITAMLDLQLMEMAILNSAELDFSSRNAEREITDLLCNILPELANKKMHRELENDSAGEKLAKIFRGNGESPYIQDLMLREYLAGEFSNIKIEDEFISSGRNPFAEKYFQVIGYDEKTKIYTVRPLFGLRTAEDISGLENVVVLGYSHSTVRRQSPARNAVERYIASWLRFRNKPADTEDIQRYKDDFIASRISDENLDLRPDGSLRLVTIIRVRNQSGALLDEYKNHTYDYKYQEGTFVRGYIRPYHIDTKNTP